MRSIKSGEKQRSAGVNSLRKGIHAARTTVFQTQWKPLPWRRRKLAEQNSFGELCSVTTAFATAG